MRTDFDADLTLVDLQGSETIAAEQLLYRHAISPYIGSELRAVVKGTWVRGRAVYRNGKFLGQVAGQITHTGSRAFPAKTQ